MNVKRFLTIVPYTKKAPVHPPRWAAMLRWLQLRKAEGMSDGEIWRASEFPRF